MNGAWAAASITAIERPRAPGEPVEWTPIRAHFGRAAREPDLEALRR